MKPGAGVAQPCSGPVSACLMLPSAPHPSSSSSSSSSSQLRSLPSCLLPQDSASSRHQDVWEGDRDHRAGEGTHSHTFDHPSRLLSQLVNPDRNPGSSGPMVDPATSRDSSAVNLDHTSPPDETQRKNPPSSGPFELGRRGQRTRQQSLKVFPAWEKGPHRIRCAL